MSRRCPECGHPTPADVAPGRAYACAKCANPVLATAHPREGSASDAPAAAGDSAPRAPEIPVSSASPSQWKMALLAFVVLGAAYVGAYELLTAEAQRDRSKLLAAHGEQVAAYRKPEPPASGEAKALREFLAAQSRYEDRQRYEACESRIAAGRMGMAVAFGAQTLFAVWVWWKSRRARVRASTATARAAARA